MPLPDASLQSLKYAQLELARLPALRRQLEASWRPARR